MKPTPKTAKPRTRTPSSKGAPRATPAASSPRRRTHGAHERERHGGRKRPTEIADERAALARRFPVHVGVDTGKSFHQLVARGPDGRRTKPFKVTVSREDFDAADQFLLSTFPGCARSDVLIGVEFAGHHGITFANFLADLGYRIVNVLPSVTKKLKEVEDNSPQKDDAKDAAQICGLLASGYFVSFGRVDEAEAELRVLTTERERLTREETRLKNRLRAVLDLCFPEFCPEFCDIDKPTPRAILDLWPTAADLAVAKPRAVLHLVKEVSRNHISPEQVRRLTTLAKRSVAITVGLDARRAEVRRMLDRWRLVECQMTDIDERLAALVAAHRNAAPLTTVPGVGVVCAATIVAELGTPDSFESPRQVLKLAGMNLAGKSSGTSIQGRVKQSKRGRPALRRQLFLLTGRWCQTRGLYREQYLALKARGQSKTSAMCAVARKLVPMLLHLMQTGEAFDMERWCAAHGVAMPAAKAVRAKRGRQSPYKAA